MQRKTKMMGGISLILILSATIPQISFISLIGIILLLVAYNWLAKEYQEKEIFSNALWAVLVPFFGIIGLAITSGILVVILLIKSGISLGFFSEIESGDFSLLSSYLWVLGIVLILWVIVSILIILSGKKWKEADYIIAEKSGEGLFKIAGNLIYIGSWLFIIIIGSFIILAGNIVKAVAFFSVKEKE